MYDKNAFEYRLTRLRGNWALTYNDAKTGKRHRHNLKTASRREAEKIAPSLMQELTQPDSDIIDNLVTAYLKDKAGRAITEKLPYKWRQLVRFFGGRRVHTITVMDCRAYVEMRRKDKTRNRQTVPQDGTIRAELLILRLILNWAKRHNLIRDVPYIETPRASPPRDRYLTQDEVQELLKHCPTPHLRLSIFLMLATAARITALLELTWDRVDLKRGLINLFDPNDPTRRKGRAIVPINNSLNLALREAYHFANSPYVIEWAGRKVESISFGLKCVARRAGIKGVSPHVFRHTAAVWMAEAGVSMSEISQYLGHSNTAITERVYARYSPDYLRNAAAALEINNELNLQVQ